MYDMQYAYVVCVQCTTHFDGVFQNYGYPLQELVEVVQFVPGVGEVILVLSPTDFGPLPQNSVSFPKMRLSFDLFVLKKNFSIQYKKTFELNTGHQDELIWIGRS